MAFSKCFWFFLNTSVTNLDVETIPFLHVSTFNIFTAKFFSIILNGKTLSIQDYPEYSGRVLTAAKNSLENNVSHFSIINNNTRSWNIVAGWSKYYFDFKTYKIWPRLRIASKITFRFISFKIKVVFSPSSYNVSTSCIIIYNQTVCPFQYIQTFRSIIQSNNAQSAERENRAQCKTGNKFSFRKKK